MGSDIAEVVDKLPDPYAFKLPLLKYKELKKLLDRISTVLPLIEAAQPPGSSGIEALGSLNVAIEKAMQFYKSCSRSSKLYLAVRGKVIVSICRRSKNLLEESLGQIQTMVPHELAEEISHIMDDLTGAKFTLNSSEEEAIKAVRRFLLQSASASDLMETSEIKALQLAASTLDITSPDAIRREKKSINKRLEDKYSDPTEKDTLNSLLHLLKKYGHLFLQEPSGNGCVQHEEAIAFEKCGRSSTYSQSVEVESQIGCQHHEVQIDFSSRAIPPEEFKCPISSRLMRDPVIIASGQTFERMNIQKWFDGGNEICPKTKTKLAHLSLTPNTAMKDLITKWCMANAVTIPDPTMPSEILNSLETSSTSIVSFGSSMNDLRLPMDLSNMSVGSLDSSYALDSSQSYAVDSSQSYALDSSQSYALDSSQSYALDSSLTMSTKEEQKSHSYAKIHEIDMKYLSKLAELQWESQCKVVEDVKNHLNESDQACHSMSSDNFVRPLVRFLKDALHLHDVKAQQAGSQLLSAFVRKNRSGISYLCEEAFSLLATFLISEVTEEALDILEFLSSQPHCKAKIAASGALISILKMLNSDGALISILKMLNSDNRDCQERAIKILCNLSSNCDICSHIVSLECIPKLVPFLVDSSLARNCVIILKNLCRTDEGRVSIAETNGCVASVAALVAAGSLEEQENAVSVLLSLCSHRVQYRQLVMRTQEDVIPALFDISVNGSDNGKVSARGLLRCLRDFKHNDDRECSGSDMDAFRDSTNLSKERNLSKASGFLGRISIFSKPKKK